MKRLVFFVFILNTVFFLSCGNKSNEEKTIPTDVVNNTNTADGKTQKKQAAFEFEKIEHDFGKIIEGEKLTYGFKFKNIGNADLIITAAEATCGCTVPEYPKKPISPGEEGIIKVMFNSSNRKGMQNKPITIIANTQPSSVVLRIKAMVVQP